MDFEMIGWDALQRDITKWGEATFDNPTLASRVAHMHKELDEVAASPGDPFEWADVLILLMHGALMEGHTMSSLYHACQAKFAIIQKREWGEPDHQGVVEHVRGGE